MEKDNSKDVIEEDEISLVDMIKVLWRWRFFILIFVVLATLGSIFYAYQKPVFYESSSIISPSKFVDIRSTSRDNKKKEDMINYYVRSGDCVKDSIAMVGEKKFYDILNSEKQDSVRSAMLKIKNIATFKDDTLTVKLSSPETAVKLNNILASVIVRKENKELERELKEYKSSIVSLLGMHNISINLPYFKKASIISKADISNVERVDNRVKIVVISFFVSIFIAVILPFVFEFFKGLDWKKVKG